jgi:pimeloyl-ACP methyl ester carboxylesterase
MAGPGVDSRVRSIRVELTQRFAIAVFWLGLSCGGPLPPPPVAPAPPRAATAPPAPPEHVLLQVFLDGELAGHETWAITHGADGGAQIEFEASIEEKGSKLHGSGTLSLAPDQTTRAGHMSLETPDGDVKGDLTSAGGAMTLRLARSSESRELKAERPSNLFLPQPFFVGLARICPLLDAGAPLVEFPGSPITIASKKPLDASITLYNVERGALGRSILACEKGDLIAALDPWNGQAAAREGKKAVLDALIAMTTRQKPKTPDGMTEDDITVTVPAAAKDAEAKLACTFLRPIPAPTDPRGKAKLPAVVFLSGSGPQDRDEDTVGPGGVKLSIFKVMAFALARKGVASLRCDDRGTARSTGSFEAATLPTFVRDAVEMVKALRTRPDVDPALIGLVGHSEGGVVAPLVALADPRIKALVLMASPGRPIPEIAILQQQRMLAQAGVPQDQIDKQVAAQRLVLDAIRTGQPLPKEVPPSEQPRIDSQRAWLKSHFDNDLTKTLHDLRPMPVLVTQGAKDAQIPPEDADLVRKALASGKNGKTRVILYPALNHLFAVSHDGSIGEYSDPDAQVDATFLTDVSGFLAQALASKVVSP